MSVPPAPAQPNQSLIDGLACLQALAGQGEPIGSRAMARLLGLEPTRVNRLLKTLAHLGLAEQDERRRYRPGPAIHVLAAQSLLGSGLLRSAIPALEELNDLGLRVALGVLWRDQVSYLYHAAPGMSAGEAIGRVGLYPAVASGLGLVLLAAAEPAAHELAGADPDLLAELAAVRERGHAVTRIETGSVRTVAVAVGRPTYAAIGLSGKFPDRRIDELVARLTAAAEHIDRRHSGAIIAP